TERTDNKNDNALIAAIGRAGALVLATTIVDAAGHTSVLGGDDDLRSLHAVAANANLPTDSGGVIRRVPYEVERLKTFSVVVAERASGRQIQPSDLGGSTAWIDYVGPPRTIPGISFARVLNWKSPAGYVMAKIVAVG